MHCGTAATCVATSTLAQLGDGRLAACSAAACAADCAGASIGVKQDERSWPASVGQSAKKCSSTHSTAQHSTAQHSVDKRVSGRASCLLAPAVRTDAHERVGAQMWKAKAARLVAMTALYEVVPASPAGGTEQGTANSWQPIVFDGASHHRTARAVALEDQLLPDHLQRQSTAAVSE